MKSKATHIPRIISIKKYTQEDKPQWDTFVQEAKNATFLFQRDFMEYHQDRFEDFSLLVYTNEKLVGLLPANRKDAVVYSHQGLTYGGLVLNKKAKLEEVNTIFMELLEFLHSEGVSSLQLKLLPTIYQHLPSDELAYLLFIAEAKLIGTDVSSTVNMNAPVRIASNRMEGVKKGQKQNLHISEDANFDAFWNEILVPNLKERFQTTPVHSLDEIKNLASHFPKNILQFNVYDGDKIVAGATIFETKEVAHVQYISANADKQKLGSLDFLFEHLLKTRFANKNYFDFGTSNENNGQQVNKGLQYWKECFGARSIACTTYEVKTSNYSKLKEIFI